MRTARHIVALVMVFIGLSPTLCLGADDSCGCLTSVDASGIQILTNGRVWMYAKTTGASGGTLDSLICWAKMDVDGVADTIYACVYDTTADGVVGDLVAVSTDSFIVTSNSGWTRVSLAFASGTINAGTRYFFGVYARGIGGTAVRIDACNDDVLSTNRREWYLDTWPLDNTSPDGTVDTTNYAPHVLIYFSDTPAGGTTKKIGAAKLGAGKW